ncbi:Cytochrome P450 9e2 [Ooceraea biroi]|uniref:Cytochrome P450 9e2 n=1 Tax=Ooceraea biroi TaxID=2015173 RepID=A0A026W902_OOCBI|nr:Cytochrome P450 9e2 [Ooceraea biroi]
MELASLFSSPFALLVITLVIIGVVKAISVVYNVYFFWSKKNVPYMPDSLSSIVGSWKLFLRRTSLPDWGQYMYYYHADAKYLGIMDFSTPGLLIRDPDLIKDITVKDFEHFPDHRTFVDENAEPLFSKNIFSLRGDRWREMRNTLSPSFTASKMKFMYELSQVLHRVRRLSGRSSGNLFFHRDEEDLQTVHHRRHRHDGFRRQREFHEGTQQRVLSERHRGHQVL